MAELVITPTVTYGLATVLKLVQGEATVTASAIAVSTRRPIHPNVATATATEPPAEATVGAD